MQQLLMPCSKHVMDFSETTLQCLMSSPAPILSHLTHVLVQTLLDLIKWVTELPTQPPWRFTLPQPYGSTPTEPLLELEIFVQKSAASSAHMLASARVVCDRMSTGLEIR